MTITLTDPAVEHRACRLCRMPINDQGRSTNDEGGPGCRGWIHTLTGQYRCPPGTYTKAGDGPAFAFPDVGEDALEDARTEAHEIGYEAGQEAGFEEGKQEGLNEGHDEGARDMYAEFEAAFDGCLDNVSATTPMLSALLDDVREALAAAWKSVVKP